MTVTININGLSLVHRGSGGVSHATLPDVCRTAPTAAPIPYANTAYSLSLAGGTMSVVVDGGNMAAVRGSVCATSVGDEAGALGGVVSGANGASASWLSHSFDVRLEGRAACRLTDKMLHNAANTIDCGGIQQRTVRTARARRGRSSRTAGAIYKLDVQVVDHNGAVNGAEVKIEGPLPTKTGRHRNTGSTNEAVFSALRRGRYRITVTAPCHLSKTEKHIAVLHTSAQKIVVSLDIPSLKQLADDKHLTLYARMDTGDDTTLQNEFHGAIVGFFWNSRESAAPGVFDFQQPGSWFMQSVQQLQTLVPKLMGTPLAWSNTKETPDWTKTYPGIHDRHHRTAVANHRLATFINTCVGQFKNQIKVWVAMNEAGNLLFSGDVRSHPFWQAFGLWDPVYDPRHPHRVPACWPSILEVFKVSHAADPSALLILNDFDVECWDGKHRAATGATIHSSASRLLHAEQSHYLAAWLRHQLPRHGVPLDRFAVGFQMHWPSDSYSVKLLHDNVRRYDAMGLQVVVTELDVTIATTRRMPGGFALFDAAQAEFLRGEPAADVNSDRAKSNGKFDFATYLAAFGRGDAFNAFLADWMDRPANKRRLEAMYVVQGKLYHDIYQALLASPNVRTIMTWGINDTKLQFRPFAYMFNRVFGCGSPYGGEIRKPAYYSVCEAIRASHARR